MKQSKLPPYALCTKEDFKLGATVKIIPSIKLDLFGNVLRKKFDAEIVYINRKHWYFMVCFKFPTGGSFRESFKFCEKDGFICHQFGAGEA